MDKYCYKDKERICVCDCAAYREKATGHCMELAAKFRLADEVGKIREILEKKEK